MRNVLIALCCALTAAAQQTPTVNLGNDANGNPRRQAKTGHVSNYDEAKVGRYTLPDPLLSSSGARVKDADTWRKTRRPEIMRLYETEIFGRVPSEAPKVTWRVTGVDRDARDGTVTIEHVVGAIGDAANAPRIPLTVFIPAKAKGPVPLILLVNFGGGGAPPPSATLPAGEPPVAADIIARGWGYATIAYQDIQPARRAVAVRASLQLRRLLGRTEFYQPGR